MNRVESVLSDCLVALRALPAQRLDREEARRVSSELRRKHPTARVEVAWRQEVATGAIEYSACFKAGLGDSVSLSVVREADIPWSVRGLVDFADRMLVRVNGRDVDIHRAAMCLDDALRGDGVGKRLIDSAICQDELEARGITVTDEMLQQAMDLFRAERGLASGPQFDEWLRLSGQTILELEHHLVSLLATAELERQIADGGERHYFEKNREEFDVAVVARAWFSTLNDAVTFRERVRGLNSSQFIVEVQRLFVEAAPYEGGHPALLRLRRSSLSPQAAAALFVAPLGEVSEALQSGDGFDVMLCLGRERPSFEAVSHVIRQRLMQGWLKRRREESDIEWFWGTDELAARAISNRSELGL